VPIADVIPSLVCRGVSMHRASDIRPGTFFGSRLQACVWYHVVVNWAMRKEGIMPQGKRIIEDLSSRRIIGFACNQGFVFFLFYMGLNRSYTIDGFSFERAESLGTLLFMVVGFGILKSLSNQHRSHILSRPLLYIYAVVMAAASLAPLVFSDASVYWLPIEGVLLGIPNAFLLTAWGRSFGEVPTSISVPEVFLGSLVGALCCLAFSFVGSSSAALLALRILPIASAALIDIPPVSSSSPAVLDVVDADTDMLSFKIIAGTLFFGMAAGLMETYNTDPGTAAMPDYPISMLLFGAFLLGALSLLLSDGFGKGAALNKSYRLAVFIMMLGVLVIPWPQIAESTMPGEAMVLAGYLGLEAVLISLFLVLAKITASDTAVSFTRGFMALFSGELIGVVLANAFDATQEGGATPDTVAVVAGVFVLFSYVFLFTERDFDALSEIVTVNDTFEASCARIVEMFALSKREAEILPYALRGRTSERVARELTISKSTVDTHLRRIYAKTGVHSRQELIDLGEASGHRNA
jgi:DNA-binding CsgD family transcriptional regulator